MSKDFQISWLQKPGILQCFFCTMTRAESAYSCSSPHTASSYRSTNRKRCYPTSVLHLIRGPPLPRCLPHFRETSHLLYLFLLYKIHELKTLHISVFISNSSSRNFPSLSALSFPGQGHSRDIEKQLHIFFFFLKRNFMLSLCLSHRIPLAVTYRDCFVTKYKTWHIQHSHQAGLTQANLFQPEGPSLGLLHLYNAGLWFRLRWPNNSVLKLCPWPEGASEDIFLAQYKEQRTLLQVQRQHLFLQNLKGAQLCIHQFSARCKSLLVNVRRHTGKFKGAATSPSSSSPAFPWG